uniref:Uncharacterized protein n=1 Tax=Candidatus Kentrum eta TaxID=2126337 RepID=A0A450UE51_9GAMM|nr:MAG: hypothetical protein BECKH772A_GA0070896_1001029 [Candidatus Kentron sp. H]VFJ90775.1 MAG: hypothetical protein BECKH772B_GA0070898_1001129 [Candidatus Kentron sp. H]VFJ96911.1 MAG: hypothetical protein BECKH772C_GA0070978_1000929 [Candidatus Kentron sp. H]
MRISKQLLEIPARKRRGPQSGDRHSRLRIPKQLLIPGARPSQFMRASLLGREPGPLGVGGRAFHFYPRPAPYPTRYSRNRKSALRITEGMENEDFHALIHPTQSARWHHLPTSRPEPGSKAVERPSSRKASPYPPWPGCRPSSTSYPVCRSQWPFVRRARPR